MSALQAYDSNVASLPGIEDFDRRESFAAQLVDSSRRRRYATRLATIDIDPLSLDPASGRFDPIRGAVLMSRAGRLDEACWLIFLSVHFGYHRRRAWDLVSAFYGSMGVGPTWTWDQIVSDLDGMRSWFDANQSSLRAADLRFGNHRKYESLSGSSAAGTGAVISSYVAWVLAGTPSGGRPEEAVTSTAQEQFRFAYKSMQRAHRFGRTARFDYLTMLGKIAVFPGLVPDSPYLSGSTGPRSGAALLLDGAYSSSSSLRKLESRLEPLAVELQVPNDVLEDALCNWQKSPNAYLPFRG